VKNGLKLNPLLGNANLPVGMEWHLQASGQLISADGNFAVATSTEKNGEIDRMYSYVPQVAPLINSDYKE
jgi:hypothetical protein